MFESSHKLDFECAPDPTGAALGMNSQRFRIGTCTGQWGTVTNGYYIMSVLNSCPGNGHFDDVLEWFEMSCKRDGYNLFVLECMNKGFYEHLISKRGFIALDGDRENVVKIFNQQAYKNVVINGNEMLVAGSLKCI